MADTKKKGGITLTAKERDELHKGAMKSLKKYGTVEAFEAAVGTRTYPASPPKGKSGGKKSGK